MTLARARQSLNARLRREAGKRGVPATYVRKQYVFALFLRRVFATDTGHWTLLGGNALFIRTGGGRFTEDIDLARATPWDDLDAVLEEFRTLIRTPVDSDAFLFDVVSVEAHRALDDDGYGAATAKLHVDAYWGGSIFETFSVDITTRRHTDLRPDMVPLRPIIEDPALESLPLVPTTPVESHLADKIAAMYEPHGARASTRYRDLADIIRIVRTLSFDAGPLDVLLTRECGRRRMPRPSAMTPPSREWTMGFPRAAVDFADFPADLRPLTAALSAVAPALDPVLSGIRVSGFWDPRDQHWSEPLPSS